MSRRPPVFGLDLDRETRCRHWRSPRDIVALRLPCCGRYYACRACHDALADHEARVWPRADFDQAAAQPAAMCGVCGHEMSAAAYLECADRCPACAAAFNPGCRLHRHLYFEG
jgi:uncharacterized CHY-type Zn-finger protein